MKPAIINQEILLYSESRFSRQEFCSKNDTANYSFIEELERACWAGLLFDLLPEIYTLSLAGRKMFVWNILTADHFLLVNQGTYPQPIEMETSVDPHLFLLSAHLN